VWPARGLNNFISAASILRLCEYVNVVGKPEVKAPQGMFRCRWIDAVRTCIVSVWSVVSGKHAVKLVVL